jgi:hypothetical protein
MGDFEDSPKWKLVNRYTIHEDKNLKDRPYMRTCVPKNLDVEVTSFEVVRYIEWPSAYGREERADAHVDRSYLKFTGELHDRITVFTMERGEIGTFRTLTDATIRPLPRGHIGGKNRASVHDGISMSGMSSCEVPATGLMEGEPGAISYLAEFEERDGREKSPASLTATLFLDEEKFSRLLGQLSLGVRPVTTFKLSILAELFESEISAALSEYWMPCEYGLLSKGSAVASAAARLETLSVSSGPTFLKQDEEADGRESMLDRLLGEAERPTERGPSSVVSHGYSAPVSRYQRLTFWAVVALIVVTLFVR